MKQGLRVGESSLHYIKIPVLNFKFNFHYILHFLPSYFCFLYRFHSPVILLLLSLFDLTSVGSSISLFHPRGLVDHSFITLF